MNTHYRNYMMLINNIPSGYTLEVEALSVNHIKDTQNNFIDEQIKLQRLNIGDEVTFKFLFCTSD